MKTMPTDNYWKSVFFSAPLQIFLLLMLSLTLFFTLPDSADAAELGSLSALGGEVGNGGDTVYCDTRGDNNLVGYFSLDYLLTYRQRNSNADVIDRSWENSKNRISSQLRTKLPTLGKLFDEFTNDLFNTNTLRKRIWNEAAFGLEDVHDERILRKLPPNCGNQTEGQSAELIQTIVRVSRPESIIYEYDYNIIDELETNSPLQFSFLMVHEWLWDFSHDIRIIRDVNRFLHSNALEQTQSTADLILALENIGISLSRTVSTPICHRSENVRLELERLAAQSCTEISSVDQLESRALENLTHNSRRPALTYQLNLDSRQIESLKFGDFSGLGKVSSVDLSHNLLKEVDRFQFQGLKSISSVILSNNKLTKIPYGTFSGMARLRIIYLDDNQITEIPKKFLISIRRKYVRGGSTGLTLSLQNNQITSIPDDFCEGIEINSERLEKGVFVRLSNNPGPFNLTELSNKFKCARFLIRPF